MNIQIITDASCDLPKEKLDSMGIVSIPGVVYIGESDFLDHETLTPDNIEEVTSQGRIIKKYIASDILFYTRLKEFAQREEEVIYIGSSRIFYNGVEQALSAKKILQKEFPNFKMTIVDSRSLSLGQGILLEWIYEHLQEIKTKEALLDLIKTGIFKLKQFCLVGQLNTLHQKGYLSTSLYMSGKVMGICPILFFDAKGEIEVLEKSKGIQSGLEKLIEYFQNNVQNPNQSKIGIVYVGQKELANKLKRRLETLGVSQISLYPGGALMGTHLGNKSIGLAFLEN